MDTMCQGARNISPYRGRFAPSPTGALHFGSLIAALGSFLAARSQGGEWLVRIEDIDTPRTVPGAADDILRTLETLGLYWDGPVLYQSRRLQRYQAALEQLIAAGLAYSCSCSRREVAQAATIGPGGPIYPGTCRNGTYRRQRRQAIRVITDRRTIACHDAIQGIHTQTLETVGDFIIRRSDGLFAYQLAVVVDDADQQISHVVRGSDLLTSTPRQIYLQHLLHLPIPNYSHLPIAVNAAGDKLSKQTRARPIDRRQPGPSLIAALGFLGQNPPWELRSENVQNIITWALANWQPQQIPAVASKTWPKSTADDHYLYRSLHTIDNHDPGFP